MLEDLVEHEHEFEQIKGIPGRLPRDENILWQGSPNWKLLAIRVFHVRVIGIYFGILALWRCVAGLHDGTDILEIIASIVAVLFMAALALGILSLVAWSVARTTVYTITNKRVLMRIGVALSLTLNLPFSRIKTAAVKRFRQRAEQGPSGNLSLDVLGDKRLTWLILWPHARPWRLAPAQPTLRCVNQIDEVADLLAAALQRAVASDNQPHNIHFANLGERPGGSASTVLAP